MWSPKRSMIIQLYARHVTSVSITSKHWTYRCRRSAIPASHHFVTSSCQQHIVTQASCNFKLSETLYTMFHILSSCDLQQDTWFHNFMRVTSRAFRLHQNFHTSCRRSAIPASQPFITSSCITSMSSRKRHATYCVVTKLYTHIDRRSFRFL